MYYSYKSKRRNTKRYKILISLLIISCAIYFGYKHRQYLLFWEYTYNKLNQAIEETSSINNFEHRKDRLLELSKICNEYKNKNQISSNAFFLSGRVHFLLGESYLKKTFSELFIDDDLHRINENSKNEFIKSIKDFKKKIVLSQSSEIQVENILTFAMACFYTDYYDINQINKILGNIDNFDSINRIDDIRFYSIINILNGKEETGLEILKKHGEVIDSLNGQLFLATACMHAKMYTNSIMEFKRVLNITSDNKVVKLVNINLGKTYFNQLLYKESLYHFKNALNIDESDNHLKIWIGKNYSALGQKTKAIAIWSQVLASDKNNEEAKKLLGLM